MVSEQQNPAPNGAAVARMQPGGNGRRTITRDYHRLINECTEKLLSNPAHTLAMRLRAQSYRMLGEDDAALADYNSLLALEPTNVDALFYRGTILERQQRIDEAIQCYTAVLQHEPHHHKALYNRAVCYSAKGSFAQAIEDFSAAIELDQQTCKGARRLRDQDPAQQQLASSLGAAADAAAAAVLHGSGGSKAHTHALPHYLLQHASEGGPALSSTNSVSDASAAGWDRWNSNASAWSTTPQSAASEEEMATAASGSGGSCVNAIHDAQGAAHSGFAAAYASYPSATASQGPACPDGAGVLVTARSNATNSCPHTAAPPPSEAGAPSLNAKLPDHDLHNSDQHGRSYRNLRLRQFAASGFPGEDVTRFAEEEQQQLQQQLQQQQPQEPSVHDSLGSWLEPRQSGGSTDAAWGQGVTDEGPAASHHHQEQKPHEGLPASAQLLAALQDAKALQLHQQAQRHQQQQQQQAEDEYVLEQLQSMFVAAQEDEHEGMLGRQAAHQKNPHMNAAGAAAARGAPHGVLREVQGQSLGNGRSNTPKGRVAVAAQRGTAGQGSVLGHLNARPHAAQGRPPGPGRSLQQQSQRHVQPPSGRIAARGGGVGTGMGSTPPALARELRSPSPFERIVQEDRSPQTAGAAAAAANGVPRHVRSNSNGSSNDRGTQPTAPPVPSHLRPSSFSSSQPPPQQRQPPPQQQHQQAHQQQQVTVQGQGASGRPYSALHQQQQPAGPRGSRDSYQMSGGDGFDYRGEVAPQANGNFEQVQQQNAAGRGALGTAREMEALQGKTANGAGGLLGLGGFGSGDLSNGCTAAAAGQGPGGGDTALEGTDPGPDDGASLLDPWVAGGHGGMAAALEMSRPSTSSSAASDPADQNSRHKAIEQFNARAFALRQQGKLVEAVREYSRALEVDPYHFKTLFNRGFTYDRLGELVAAVEDYTQALAVDSQSSYAHYNRGITRDRLQDFAGAVEDFTAAIRLEPNSADFYHNRGFALRKQGMFEAAIQDYTTAIMLNPNHCRAFYNRAFCHDRLNHVQQAIDDYTKALEMEPNNATALHNRGSLHERNSRSDLALHDFDQAIRVDPNCAQSYNARGLLLQHLGRLEEAQADLDMAVALMQPPSASLFRSRAQIRRERGDHYGAVQDLTRAIALDPGDLLSYSRRAHCFRRMGEYESAIRDYTRAIALSPNNPKLHTIRAYCYAMIEWYGEAVADYDVVLSLEPNNAHAGYNRSIALEKLGGAIDRAAAELSAAAAAGSGGGVPSERARPQSSSAQAGGQGGPGGRGGPVRSHSYSAMAELPAAGGDYGGGAPASTAAAMSNGMQRSLQTQGMPPPKQAWASMDGRYLLQQPQQHQGPPPPPPLATRMSAGASLGSGSGVAAASFRGPSPMRGGGGAGPASASGRVASTWGSGHPAAAAAAAAAGGMSVPGVHQYRGSQGSAQGLGGMVNGAGSVYRSQQLYPQQQPQARQQQQQQQQQQWYGVEGGLMSNGAVHGGRSRTPHRVVAVP